MTEGSRSIWEEWRRQILRDLLRDGRDPRVVQAIAKVPRERFVPASLRQRAYENVALPIAFGQSISQISVVALMTEALSLHGEELVLEVGTGSGYHAAVLAELASRVVTVERHSRLAASAASRLSALGYAGVTVHTARPNVLGFPESGPYQAILVSAAAPSVPKELLEQLQPNGRLVLPVDNGSEQQLMLVVRDDSGAFTQRVIGRNRFVPLIFQGTQEVA
jgi:protein-L-isoaspartate(D-aspartate) O-methyltransferase